MSDLLSAEGAHPDGDRFHLPRGLAGRDERIGDETTAHIRCALAARCPVTNTHSGAVR